MIVLVIAVLSVSEHITLSITCGMYDLYTVYSGLVVHLAMVLVTNYISR